MNRVFHKLDEIGNNTNIDIRGFTMWNKKKSIKNVTPSAYGASDSNYNTPFSAKWAFIEKMSVKFFFSKSKRILFYRPQTKFAKVMFYAWLSVIKSTGGGVCTATCTHLHPPPPQKSPTHPWKSPTPPPQMATEVGGTHPTGLLERIPVEMNSDDSCSLWSGLSTRTIGHRVGEGSRFCGIARSSQFSGYQLK